MSDDTGVRKILPVGDSGWMVLTAGSMGYCDTIVRRAVARTSDNPEQANSASGMASCFEDAFRTVFEEVAVEDVLKPNLLTKELWSARSKDLLPLPGQIVDKPSDRLDKFSFGCSLLVCGFDGGGNANIILINSPGIATNQTNSGYGVIGNGWQVAIGRLLWQKVTRIDALEEVLYEVFDAKAHAEQIQGVGFAWDSRIMLRGRTETPPKRITRIIERVWDSATDSPFDKTPPKKPDNWQKTLKDYARTLMRHPVKKKR